ncbi:MAG: L,D-transpeptidase family protein [Planctomycetes bacterium]|nr:L,D-transpeptidase family protein [Planctomycetota bacterium]
MRRTSFASSPSRRPRGRALVVGLSIVTVLCWWLWPEEDPVTPELSARTPPSTQEKPRGESKPQSLKRSPEPEIAKVMPAPDDPLAPDRRKLGALRKGGDADALRRQLSSLALHPRAMLKDREAWLKEADKLNARLVWSATPGPGFTTVKVEPSDSYWEIARRMNAERGTHVTAGMLEAINKVRPNKLRLGQSLKVPTEKVSLLVDKSSCEIYVLLGGVYVKRFPVGIGKDSSTPEGTFTVQGKTAKPVWTDPKTGRRYAYGEKGHLIGSRWLGFYKDGGPTGYGTHGTIDPETIGQAVSEGCIRLVNSDVEELYELVLEGASVRVRR